IVRDQLPCGAWACWTALRLLKHSGYLSPDQVAVSHSLVNPNGQQEFILRASEDARSSARPLSDAACRRQEGAFLQSCPQLAVTSSAALCATWPGRTNSMATSLNLSATCRGSAVRPQTNSICACLRDLAVTVQNVPVLGVGYCSRGVW